MDSLYIVMPAYNEEETIGEVVRSWYPILTGKSPASRLIVADSGSTDNTHMILNELQKEYPQLEILDRTQKQHGPKLIALYDHAVKNKIDYIFQTDSDGQTCPEEFERFWKNRKKYDAIFGCRIKRGDGKMREFVERVVCILLRIYFGVRIPDANAPFRLMRTETVKRYLYRLPSDYNLPNIMLTTYCTYYHDKVKFCPITFKKRSGGVNSINFRKITRMGWHALSDFSRFRKEMNIRRK